MARKTTEASESIMRTFYVEPGGMVGVAHSYNSGSGFVNTTFEALQGAPGHERSDEDYTFLRIQEGDTVIVRRHASPGGKHEVKIECNADLAAKSEALTNRVASGERFKVDYASPMTWREQFNAWAGCENMADLYDALTDAPWRLTRAGVLLRIHADSEPRYGTPRNRRMFAKIVEDAPLTTKGSDHD